MVAFSLTNTKEFMSHLLLADTFDSFCFIEGEVITFNIFRIDGTIQKDFFDTGESLPEYSTWETIRKYCLFLIRGKRTPVAFRFIFSLSPLNISRLIEQYGLPINAEDVRGLYLNIRFDGANLSCVTGASFHTFQMDRTLEHTWDETAEKFLKQKKIEFEKI